MSEFKIKVSVELDSSDLESKLNALGKDQKIKLDIDSSGLDKIEKSVDGKKFTRSASAKRHSQRNCAVFGLLLCARKIRS